MNKYFSKKHILVALAFLLQVTFVNAGTLFTVTKLHRSTPGYIMFDVVNLISDSERHNWFPYAMTADSDARCLAELSPQTLNRFVIPYKPGDNIELKCAYEHSSDGDQAGRISFTFILNNTEIGMKCDTGCSINSLESGS